MIQNQKKYLPKSKRSLAEQLARKRYLSSLLADLTKEKEAIQQFLNHYPTTRTSELLLTQSPEIRNLLNLHPSPESLPAEWTTAEYPKNPNHPEHLIHESISGNKVRSKSESIIDSFLFMNQIPYRYECELILGNTVLYPDFTILHPKTGNIYYWEHFGLMNDVAYARNAVSKLQLYISHKIIPSIQLITTYETKEVPLSPSTVESILTQYFL